MNLTALPGAAAATPALAEPPPRTPEADAAWRTLHQAACAPYRQAGRFAWHFARGKLGRDPVFRWLAERAALPGGRVIDIGCGQGLMAGLLQAVHDRVGCGQWPACWPAPVAASAYLGIELMPRDVARAEAATASLTLAPRFRCEDMRQAVLPPCETVVILDALHYVDHAAQSALLTRVRDALLQGRTGTDAPPRRLLLRVGDAADTRGFAASQWVDRIVSVARGHRVPPTWGRPLAHWTALLHELGFAVQALPMSQGTPFANVLLLADVLGEA
jgi:SAM-dependent methyltransferase